MGSLTYNLLDFDTRDGHSANPMALRFVGRVAVRLTRATYVGFAVGSWVRVYEGCVTFGGCSRDYYDEYSEVVNHSLFVQRYAGSRWFLRAGAGVALTEVLRPVGDAIESTRHARRSLTAGTGYDVPFFRRMLLTPSIDYTVLPSTPHGGGEIHSALAYGIGITLR